MGQRDLGAEDRRGGAGIPLRSSVCLFQAGEQQGGNQEHLQPLHPCHPQPSGVPPSTHSQHGHPRTTPKRGNRAGDTPKRGNRAEDISCRMCPIRNGILGISAAPMEQQRTPLAVSPSTRLVPGALWSGETCLAAAAKAQLCFPAREGRSRASAKHSVGFGVCSGCGVPHL